MAYMSGQSGPLPHLKGEFYANWHPELPVVAQFEHEEVTPDWTKVRRGRPRPAGGRNSAQMAAAGWVGLYLIRDLPLSPHAVAVDAPDWMSEPPVTE